MSTGSEDLHYLLEDAFDGDEISDTFRYRAQAELTFAGGPLYAILHEACYAQETATRWAAQRIRDQFPAFSAEAALDNSDPILFTGEMIYPWTHHERSGAQAARRGRRTARPPRCLAQAV